MVFDRWTGRLTPATVDDGGCARERAAYQNDALRWKQRADSLEQVVRQLRDAVLATNPWRQRQAQSPR
jgi:hypothetical protein